MADLHSALYMALIVASDCYPNCESYHSHPPFWSNTRTSRVVFFFSCWDSHNTFSVASK